MANTKRGTMRGFFSRSTVPRTRTSMAEPGGGGGGRVGTRPWWLKGGVGDGGVKIEKFIGGSSSLAK